MNALFLRHGNINRSPAAEILLKKMAPEKCRSKEKRRLLKGLE